MKKRFFSSLGVVALVASLLAFAAPSAFAAPPFDTQNFLPDDSNVNPNGNVLSDKFDGTDSAAHLANVSTADTDFVTFFVCPSNTTDGPGETTTVTNAELANCAVIGTDSTPQQPSGGNPGFNPTDEAYEFFWNIPSELDLRTRDIVVAACTGTPGTVVLAGGINPNCVFDVEQDVVLEDAQTGNATIQTSAAEMFSICTADTQGTGGPGAGTNVCQQGGLGAGTNAEVAARFKPFRHGDNLPNEGFVIRVTTDPEVDFLDLGIEVPGDAQNDPNLPFFDNALNCGNFGGAITEAATFNVFQCVFTDAQVPDNAEFALVAFDADAESGSGLCDNAAPTPNPNDFDGDGTQNPPPGIGNENSTGTDFATCKLDVHYAVSIQRAATSIVLSFETTNATCAAPDTAETNRLGELEDVFFCLNDQFNDPFSGAGGQQATITSAGVGFIEDCGASADASVITAHDHNGDQEIDECHYTSAQIGADGRIDDLTIRNDEGAGVSAAFNATPGDQTLTGCRDTEAPGTNAAPGANSGCGNETVKTSIVKTWISQPTDIELVFAPRGVTTTAAEKQALCLSGDKFKENVTGEQDTLIVCTFDDAGNFTGTTAPDNGRLQWFITPSGGGELTATRFTTAPGNPPNDTNDNGVATAEIEAFRQGNDIITVCGQNDPGENNFPTGFGDPNCSSVQKRVTQGPGGTLSQCEDGIDNDGDGQTDFPADPQCTSANDNSEAGPVGPEEIRHARTIKITRIRHVFLPNKPRPALLIKGVVTAPSFGDCATNVPIKVQIRAGGEWITRKTDTTNGNGVFKVLIRDIQAKYRARATRFEIADPSANVVHVCQKATDVRRHGH